MTAAFYNIHSLGLVWLPSEAPPPPTPLARRAG